MSWMKEANKLGRYVMTYRCFRVYCTKEPETQEIIEDREDGQWRVTNFIKGEFVAIDKKGVVINGTGLESLGFDIDKELFIRSLKD